MRRRQSGGLIRRAHDVKRVRPPPPPSHYIFACSARQTPTDSVPSRLRGQLGEHVLGAAASGGPAAVDAGGGQALRDGAGGVLGGHPGPVVSHRGAATGAERRRGVGALPGAGP